MGNKAIVFDGATSYVDTSLIINGDVDNPLTVSFWCRFKSVSKPWQSLVDAYGGTGDDRNFQIGLGSDGKLYVYHNGVSHGGYGPLEPHRWYHIVYTYPGLKWNSTLSAYDANLAGAYDYNEDSWEIVNHGYGQDANPQGRAGHGAIGKFGKGYNFDRRDASNYGGYLDLGPNFLDSENFTFFTWIYWRNNTSYNAEMVFSLGTDSTRYIQLSPMESSYTSRVSLRAKGYGYSEEVMYADGRLGTYRWQHLGVRLKDRQARIYLDGRAIDEHTSWDLSPSKVLGTDNSLGKGFDSWYYLDGILDGTYFWDVALDGDAIDALYNNGKGRFITAGIGKLYIDGSLIEEIDVPEGTPRDIHVVLGRRSDGEENTYFDGTLDEVYVWEKGLEQDTVSSLYNRRMARINTPEQTPRHWDDMVGEYDGNLIAAWTFEEDGWRKYQPDLTGNDHYVYYQSGRFVPEGKIGSGLFIEGDYQTRAYSRRTVDIFDRSFTMSLWARQLGGGTLLSQGYAGTNRRFRIYWSGITFQWAFGNSDTWSVYPAPDDDEWHNFLIVYDKETTTQKLFVDGKVYPTKQGLGPLNLDTGFDYSFTIGARDNNWDQNFTGYFDLIYIWKGIPDDHQAFADNLYNGGRGLIFEPDQSKPRNDYSFYQKGSRWSSRLAAKDSSLISHWPLGGIHGSLSRDEIGDNHGNISGDVDYQFYRAISLGMPSLDFDGDAIQDYIYIDDSSDFDVSAMTFAFWFCGDTWTNSTAIRLVDRQDTSGSGDGFYIRRVTTDGPIRFNIHLGVTDYYVESDAGVAHEFPRWHHIAVTWDGSVMKMYLDGEKQADETSTAVGPFSSTRRIELGRSGSGTEPFNGKMAEMYFWSTALSEDELSDLYNGGSTCRYTRTRTPWSPQLYDYQGDIISWWRLDDDRGELRDAVSENHGQPNGTILYEESGNISSSVYFNGTDSYIDCGVDSSLSVDQDLTLSAWVKRDGAWSSSDVFVPICSKGSRSSGSYGIGVLDASGGKVWPTFWVRYGGSLYEAKVEMASDWGVDEWKNIVGVFSGQTLVLYINGEVMASSTSSGVSKNSVDFYIGKEDGSSVLWKGNIEQVAIWKSALQTEVVSSLYNSGNGANLPGPDMARGFLSDYDANLVHGWKFTELDGQSIVRDVVGTWNATPTQGAVAGANGVGGGHAGFLKRPFYDGASNDYFSLGDLPVWASRTKFSFSCWIKIKNRQGGYVFYQGNYGEWNVYAWESELRLAIRASGGGYYYAYGYISPVDEWVHIAGTWERNKYVSIYVNGEMRDSVVVPDEILYNPGGGYDNGIGSYRNRNQDNTSFDGSIAEFYIWDSALSPYAIKELYRDGWSDLIQSERQALADSENYLVSSWTLNESSGQRDDNRSGNHLTENGSVSSATGVNNLCADFSGANSLYNTEVYGVPHGGEAYSISCWVKADSLPGTWTDLWAIDTEGSTKYVALRLMSDGKLRHIEDHDGEVYQESSSISTGTWYHVVCTFNGSKLRLFVDNVESGTGTVAETEYRAHNFVLGQSYYSYGSTTYFDGKIDEVYLYSIALRDEAIEELYNDGGGTFYSYDGWSPILTNYDREMVSAWDFEESSGTLADIIGDANALPYGGLIYEAVGKKGNCLFFNGINAYAEATYIPTDDFTISFWVKTADSGVDAEHWFGGKGIIDGTSGEEDNCLGITLCGNKVAFGTGSPKHTLKSANDVNTGEWVHVAVTRKGYSGNKTIYINGEIEAEGEDGLDLLSDTTTLKFGASHSLDSDKFFNGYLDEVYIWQRRLSGSAIKELYNKSKGRFFSRESRAWPTFLSLKDANLRSVWNMGDFSSLIWDSKGSYPGTLYGTGNMFLRDGRYGKALGFNGIDDYVEIMDSTDPTAYTISVWVKPNDSQSMDIFFRSDVSNNRSHAILIDDNGYFEHRVNDGSMRELNSYTICNPGRWYHLVITAENLGYARLYVDGIEEASYSTLATIWTGGDRWRIGRSSRWGWFAGTIDEVMYWDIVLSSEEIRDLYNYGSGRFYSGSSSSSSSSA